MWNLSFGVWVTSLSIFSSSFVYLQMSQLFFFFITEQYSIVRMCDLFIIHSAVEGHLGCLHFQTEQQQTWLSKYFYSYCILKYVYIHI